jgi:hypothetical protein
MDNAMRRSIVWFAVIALAACGGTSKSPTPTAPTIIGTFESLPTHQYRLLDSSGEKISVWTQLHFIQPERGSQTSLGTANACQGCFHFQVMLGFIDQSIDGNVQVQIGLSHNRTEIGQHLLNTTFGRGQTALAPTSRDQIWPFSEKFEYLVVKATANICQPGPTGPCSTATLKREEGAWAFETGYR